MTKREIVKTIAEELGLSQLQVGEIVQKTIDTIVDTLATEGRVELRNFGVFEVKKRAPRKARNPRTGDAVSIPERLVVTFKPGKVMEKRVLQGQQGLRPESFTKFIPRDPAEPDGDSASVSPAPNDERGANDAHP